MSVDRRHPRVLLAVGVGGGLGTIARAALAESVVHGADAWPWATFAVNLVGALLLGWWATWPPPAARARPTLAPLLTTGLCGGLTTFSTLQLELVLLLRDGAVGLALGYVAATLAGGLAAALLGVRLARAIERRTGVPEAAA